MVDLAQRSVSRQYDDVACIRQICSLCQQHLSMMITHQSNEAGSCNCNNFNKDNSCDAHHQREIPGPSTMSDELYHTNTSHHLLASYIIESSSHQRRCRKRPYWMKLATPRRMILWMMLWKEFCIRKLDFSNRNACITYYPKVHRITNSDVCP